MLQVLVKNYDVYNIRPTFFNGNTLHKLLCKPKGRTARENKNNIAVATAEQSTLVNIRSLKAHSKV